MAPSDDVVLDASALLAMLLGEPGADRVQSLLGRAVISAVNWTEVLERFQHHGVTMIGKQGLIQDLGIRIEAYTAQDARAAAEMRETTRSAGLSLADRACLALANRLGASAHTADRVWADIDLDVEVVVVR